MYLLGGIYLAGAWGSNDAANVFGTAVASGMVRYRTAVLLAGGFIILGAVVGGWGGIETLSTLSDQTLFSAFLICMAAALTVRAMTRLHLPVSTSQAVVGAVLGAGLACGAAVDYSLLPKVIGSWIAAPVVASVLALLLYPSLAWVIERMRLRLITRSIVLKSALTVGGCYGAYALGANNVGNIMGVFQAAGAYPEAAWLLRLIGGAGIALGALTFSRSVMLTVGSRLVALDAFSALVAVLSQAGTVHLFALIGVPVSVSQAIVGAVLGIGLAKSVRTINRRLLLGVLFGWVGTPMIAGSVCFAAAKVFL